jgi:hypothetical protein
MFGLFWKREDRERKAVRLEFESMTTMVRSARPMIQACVGHGINMANTVFIARFGSIDNFRALPKNEKMEYVFALGRMEQKLAEKNDPDTCIGYALFKKWVGALALDDADLEKQFTPRLAELSRKGDLFSGHFGL